jgi:hypothetical protein
MKSGGARPQLRAGSRARSFCLPTRRLDYASRVVPSASTPTRAPNIHPAGLNVPRINDDGFEELCHLVTDEDPDTALCGKDVTGYPWNPPWPWCEACVAVSRGEMN